MRDIVKKNETHANESTYIGMSAFKKTIFDDFFKENVAKLNTWLQKVDKLVEKNVETSLDNASDYVDIYKNIQNDEIPDMENRYRGASQSAQNLCRSGPFKNNHSQF